MAEEKIMVLAKVKAKEGMVKEVKQELMSLVATTRSEPGCIDYNLHQSTDDESLFMFYENWTSKQALDEHIQTPHLQAFIAKADKLLAEPLDITIWKKLS